MYLSQALLYDLSAHCTFSILGFYQSAFGKCNSNIILVFSISVDEESDCDSAVSSSRSDLSHSPTSELSRVSRTLSDDTNTSTEPTLTATSSLITTDRPAQQDRTSLNNDRVSNIS